MILQEAIDSTTVYTELQDWQQKFEACHEDGKLDMINHSGKLLVDRYCETADGFSAIFRRVGIDRKSSETQRKRISHGITLQVDPHSESSVIAVIREEEQLSWQSCIGVATEISYVNDQLAMQIRHEAFKVPFELRGGDRGHTVDNVLHSKHEWGNARNPSATAHYRTVHEKIVPVIMRAEDTLVMLNNAINDERLNPQFVVSDAS